MARLPKMPKGLKASINRMNKKLAKRKAIDDRKKEIAKLRAQKESLAKKLRGY